METAYRTVWIYKVRRLAANGNSYVVTIPGQWMHERGLKNGDRLILRRDGKDALTITPARWDVARRFFRLLRGEPESPVKGALGRAIRRRRLEMKLSLRELRAKSGVHESQISKAEHGLAVMSDVKINALARALKLDPNYLMKKAGRT